MKVVVVGLGYVGAVTAACLAKLGHTVVGVDIDPHKLDPLEAAKPDRRTGLDELVASGSESGRLTVSSDLALGARRGVVLVSVGTPARSDGTVDLGYVERVTEELGARHRRTSGVPRRSSTGAPFLPELSTARMRPILERTRDARGDRLRGRDGSGVPPRGERRRTTSSLPRSPSPVSRTSGHSTSSPRPSPASSAGARADDRGCRVPQVRVQRVPRRQDHVRQRDRSAARGGRRRRRGT